MTLHTFNFEGIQVANESINEDSLVYWPIRRPVSTRMPVPLVQHTTTVWTKGDEKGCRSHTFLNGNKWATQCRTAYCHLHELLLEKELVSRVIEPIEKTRRTSSEARHTTFHSIAVQVHRHPEKRSRPNTHRDTTEHIILTIVTIIRYTTGTSWRRRWKNFKKT